MNEIRTTGCGFLIAAIYIGYTSEVMYMTVITCSQAVKVVVMSVAAGCRKCRPCVVADAVPVFIIL